MPYISRETKRKLFLFALMYCAATLIQMIRIGFPISNLASILYSSMLIAWSLTLYRRITQKKIQGYLIAIALCQVLLFLLRMARYSFWVEVYAVHRWLWYWYYIPMITVPMLSLFCALWVGKIEEDHPLKHFRWLWAIWGILILGFITNDLHQYAFRFTVQVAREEAYRHGWLYFAYWIWVAMLTLGSFIVLIHRCHLSQCKKMAWIPVTVFLFFSVLLVIYTINGGSPKIYGHSLYLFQEVWCMMFVGLWEGSIQIGLIPSNGSYDEIFHLSSLRAFLTDANNKIVYRSRDYSPLTEEQLKSVGEDIAILSKDVCIRNHSISGGKVYWEENRRVINRLNERLQDAASYIEEENTLLEEENRIKEMQVRYETKNRLYDDIALGVHNQLVKIDELIQEEKSEDFHNHLCKAAILGAYVKRRANLMLNTENSERIDMEELRLSIRESMEYMKLAGITCAVFMAESVSLPADRVFFAYDFFEYILENTMTEVDSFMVYLSSKENFQVTIVLDAWKNLQDAEWNDKKLAEQRGSFTVTHEDGVVYAKLTFEKEGLT